jgi:hypothetical protein
MPAVNETIVREYFELNGFLVRQFRKHVAPAGREDDDIDFLVLNPRPEAPPATRPFVLSTQDLSSVERAVVVLKAWHTDVFTPALLNNTHDFFRFLQKRTFQQAVARFGKGASLLKILALPALPEDAHAREQSLAILRDKGLDAVISFRTILASLVNYVEPNRNYQKSDVLQLIRILKNYRFFKDPQLDLFLTKGKQPPSSRAQKSAVAPPPSAPPAQPG